MGNQMAKKGLKEEMLSGDEAEMTDCDSLLERQLMSEKR